MDEIKQFIKTASEPQELRDFTILLYDSLCITNEKYNTIESFFDDSDELFF